MLLLAVVGVVGACAVVILTRSALEPAAAPEPAANLEPNLRKTFPRKRPSRRANPAATVFLLDLAVPYRYLEIRGDAEITPDDDYSFADQLGAKYQSDLRSHDQPGQSRVKVTIRPTRINAVDMRG